VDYKIVPRDRANPFGQVEYGRLDLQGLTIPVIQASSLDNTNSSVSNPYSRAANVKLTYSNGTVELDQPLVPPTSPHNKKESVGAHQVPEVQEEKRISQPRYSRNEALRLEIEDSGGDGRLVINSPDFSQNGMCVLILYADAREETSYWAITGIGGLVDGLLLRPVPGISRHVVYERIGYVRIDYASVQWLNALEARIVSLV
jgi:hypothetical protein